MCNTCHEVNPDNVLDLFNVTNRQYGTVVPCPECDKRYVLSRDSANRVIDIKEFSAPDNRGKIAWRGQG